MMLTVEYLTGLLSQIESLTKELKDSESANASLHRQLDHWQEISVHWRNARDVLVDERDELTLIVERVTADMRALAAERDAQSKAADHWMSEACRDHNALQKLIPERYPERYALSICIDTVFDNIKEIK